MKTNIKKIRIILLLVLFFVLILVLDVITKEKMVSYKFDPNTSKVIITNNLYTVTNNGEWYGYNDKKKLVLRDKNVIFYACDGVDSLSINNMGVIKQYQTLYHEGRVIGTIPGAREGCFSNRHIVILTKNGEIYIKGEEIEKNSNFLGLGELRKTEEFIKIESLPKIKKVICGDFYTCVLTEKGEVYCSGRFQEKEFKQFTKIETKENISDITSNNDTIVFLTSSGHVVQNNSVGVFDFGRFDPDKVVKSVFAGYKTMVGVDNQGYVYYCGANYIQEKPWKPVNMIKVKRLGQVDGAICNDKAIYSVKGNKIIYMPLNQQSIVDKFISAINIFDNFK